MDHTGQSDRGIRTPQSGADPTVVPAADQQAGDEGVDATVPNEPQDTKEPLDPPEHDAR
jgi:hypothetical protein